MWFLTWGDGEYFCPSLCPSDVFHSFIFPEQLSLLSVGLVFSCNTIILLWLLQLQICCVHCVLEKCEPTLILFHLYCPLSASHRLSLLLCHCLVCLHFCERGHYRVDICNGTLSIVVVSDPVSELVCFVLVDWPLSSGSSEYLISEGPVL